MKVEIITGEKCGYCDMAKELLQENKIIYTELAVIDNYETMSKYNLKTVPQIFVNGKLLGGYTDLKEKIGDLVEN